MSSLLVLGVAVVLIRMTVTVVLIRMTVEADLIQMAIRSSCFPLRLPLRKVTHSSCLPPKCSEPPRIATQPVGHRTRGLILQYWGGRVRTSNLLVNRNAPKYPIPVIFG